MSGLLLMLSNVYFHVRTRIKGGRWRQDLLEIFAICIIALSIWVPRRISLNRIVTPDEPSWIERSENFILALKQGNYSETYQKEHPGVTLMWVGYAAYNNLFREYQNSYPEYRDKLTTRYFVNGISKRNPLEILVESRKILALIHTVTLLLSYWFTRRLIGIVPALLSFTFIAFDPFHLALTRVLHLDGLLANFYILSLLAYISYTLERKRLDLVICGISAGLAWLTKSPGLFLIPTYGLITLIQLWQNTRNKKQSLHFGMVWHKVWPLGVLMLIGALVYYALWPAMWVSPREVLTNVLGMAQAYADAGHDTGVFFNGRVIEGSEFGLRYLYFYPLTLLWRMTPLILIGIIAFVVGYIGRQKPFSEQKIRWFSMCLVIAVGIYTVLMTLGQKKFDRYLLPVYPPLCILAAQGWYVCFLWFKDKFVILGRKMVILALFGIVIGLQAYSSLSIFPYDLAYYNPVMGGSQKAPEVMQIGWGEGLDLAALYLNNKPNAEDTVASSWYSLGPFSYFFHGEVVNIPTRLVLENNWQGIYSSDYIVVYVHQWQRNMPEELLSELSGNQPEHVIWINGIEYVRIYGQ